jgi:sulfide:quinone oxidoreductase
LHDQVASTPADRRPHVLVVGGGVAALEFVLGLTELVPGVADVELVSPERAFVYRPLAIADAFGAGTPYHLELAKLAARLEARVHSGHVLSVDTARRVAVTAAGAQLSYDVLVVACGARGEEGLPGALTFRGERDEQAFRSVLAEVKDGTAASLAFVVPAGASWPLPVYELALMTAAELRYGGISDRRLLLVTPEERPLARFGEAASDAVSALLAEAAVEAHCAVEATEAADGKLAVAGGGSLRADRVVTLPRLRGPGIVGLPGDGDGFLPVDAHGLVDGLDDVYAAGDATAFPVKQGGLAVQQADAVAEAVAARLGAPIRPEPFRPVLRGLLLTGAEPRFLAADLAAGEEGESSAVAAQPLWWPPGKIAGGWLARFLHAEGIPVPPAPGGPGTLEVELELAGATDR